MNTLNPTRPDGTRVFKTHIHIGEAPEELQIDAEEVFKASEMTAEDYAKVAAEYALEQSRIAKIPVAEDIAGKNVEHPRQLEPDPQEVVQHDTSAADNAILEEIDRLAQLSLPEYEGQRKEVAEKLDMRIGVLDDVVSQKRKQFAASANSKNLFDEVVPWPHPVDGAALLQEIAELLDRHVILPEHASAAVALWGMMTYMVDASNVLPIMTLSSAEKRCGKTTLLDIISRLVHKPLPASNISASALYRVVEKDKPTLLLDEADTWLKNNEDMRNVLNSGHSRATARTIRCVGDNHEATAFSTYCPKLIALIGSPPGTIEDRSIMIRLQRKLGADKVEKIRGKSFDVLRSKMARWAKDNMAAVKGHDPAIPNDLNDRAADNWETMLSIADVAGGKWPAKARKAALALSGSDSEKPSYTEQLLMDIRDLPLSKWIKADDGSYCLRSGDLARELCADPTKQWATFNNGRELTANKLTRLLERYNIKAMNIRYGKNPEDVIRGYRRDWFDDAWERYLPDTSK